MVLLAVFRDNAQVSIVEEPLPEPDTDLCALAHPDARHLQRARVLSEFLRSAITLPWTRPTTVHTKCLSYLPSCARC